MKHPTWRSVPAVEKMLQALGELDLPRPVVAQHVRTELAGWRRKGIIPSHEEILAGLRLSLARVRQSRLQPVINATGVLLHTNLGRAPLAGPAVAALARAAGYCNLELDLATGQRGQRGAYLEHCLALLCGAEAATVVNNCAAALVLILRGFAQPPRHEVLISRGELVQIGGGFRIPEILEASGARLREVGTTNKTTVADYARALGPKTGMILKVHRSNFFLGGFVASPASEEIAALARKKRVPFVEDLGSGAVLATEQHAPLEHEPTPAESLKGGVDLVCCSGDKLLGGPQAGVIAGKARWVALLKRDPFFRALRCDKLTFAALQATVDAYLTGTAEDTVPILALLRLSPEALRQRAESLAAALRDLPCQVTVAEGRGQVGGGTLPRSTLPSVVLRLKHPRLAPAELAARLRAGRLPIVGVVSGGAYQLDLRTVDPADDATVLRRLREALADRPTTPAGEG
jgi:L-seryl-tRNA(Ser) seleniumtransferase